MRDLQFLGNLAISILTSENYTLPKAIKEYSLNIEESNFVSKKITELIDVHPEMEEF
jgi:hypothetical protein